MGAKPFVDRGRAGTCAAADRLIFSHSCLRIDNSDAQRAECGRTALDLNIGNAARNFKVI
jgi:hypothetical protein